LLVHRVLTFYLSYFCFFVKIFLLLFPFNSTALRGGGYSPVHLGPGDAELALLAWPEDGVCLNVHDLGNGIGHGAPTRTYKYTCGIIYNSTEGDLVELDEKQDQDRKSKTEPIRYVIYPRVIDR
jgi:hypothetical protein